MSEVPKDLDRNLWVILPGCCDRKHYLGYNPHTFHGRMKAWCPKLGRWTNISKREIERCSEQAKYWIIGYLSGNEPDAPRSAEGDYLPDDSDAMKLWRVSINLFAETGYWNGNERTCGKCGCGLTYSQISDICANCAQQGAAPNGGPATRLGNPGVAEGPPSVS